MVVIWVEGDLVYGWGDRCDFQDLLEAIDGEVADTDTRGKSIPLSLLKILLDRGDISPREVDEIHIQLPQSQLVQTYCDGFTHI